MSVTQVGTPAAVAVTTGSLSGTVTGSWGTGQTTTAGDLLVAVVTAYGTTSAGAIAESSGTWTQQFQIVSTGGSGRSRVAVFTKKAVGGDTAPTFTATMTGTAASARMSAYLYEVTGQDPTTPVSASLVASATISSNTPSLSATTSGGVLYPGCYAISGWQVDYSAGSTATWAPGSGWTNSYNTGATSNRATSASDTLAGPLNGATLTESVSVTTGGTISDFTGGLIVIQPAAPYYAIGSAATAVSGNTVVIPVTKATTAGDAIIVGASANSITVSPTSCADSKGNTYVLKTSHSGDKYDGAMFVAVGSTTALTTSDTITVTYSSTSSTARNAGAVGCSGCVAVDVTPTPGVNATGSTTPLLASGALAQASELLVSWQDNGNSGGNMTWGGSWAPQITGIVTGTTQISSIAAQVVASTASVNATGTLTGSAPWAIMLVSLTLATPAVPGAAALAGTGSLTAGSTQTIPAAAPLAGTGSLTAGGSVTAPGGAALAGSGTLTGASGSAVSGGAALSGQSALTAGGTVGPVLPPKPTVPFFPAGYKPVAADFYGWWYLNALFHQTKVVFRARQLTTTNLISADGSANVIKYDTVDEDPWQGWSASGFKWTAPITGWYQITVTAFTQALPTGAMLVPIAGGSLSNRLAVQAAATAHTAGAEGSYKAFLIAGQSNVQGCVALLGTAIGISTSNTAGQNSSLEIAWIGS